MRAAQYFWSAQKRGSPTNVGVREKGHGANSGFWEYAAHHAFFFQGFQWQIF